MILKLFDKKELKFGVLIYLFRKTKLSLNTAINA